MSINENGFNARRFEEIVNEINRDQIENISPKVNTNPSTLLGVITNIFASSITEQEELLQAVIDNGNIDKAEGKYLDDLAALTNTERLGESAASGFIEVSGEEGTVVPAGSEFLNDNGDVFIIQTSKLLTSTEAVSAKYDIPLQDSLVGGEEFTVTINGVNYTYEAVMGDQNVDILDGLISLINADPNSPAFVEFRVGKVTDRAELVLETKQTNNPFSSSAQSPITLLDVTTSFFVVAEESGELIVPPLSVTVDGTGILGISGVTNTNGLDSGRGVETDEQLRARVLEQVSVSGSSTLPAILSSVLNVRGVTSARVVENASVEPNPTLNLPGNSFKVIVVGGGTGDIAQTIFNNRPAGIETVGNISTPISFEGETYEVKFSRPTPAHLLINAQYRVYDEEVFPENGEELIESSVQNHFNSLGVGVDVLPQRAYSDIYKNVPGISELVIAAIRINSPLPSGSTIFPISEVNIPISDEEFSSVAVGAIAVTKLTS